MPTFSAWPVKFAEGKKEKNHIRYVVHQKITLTSYYSPSKTKLAVELNKQC